MTRLIAAGSDDGRSSGTPERAHKPAGRTADFGRGWTETGAASVGLSAQENDAIVRPPRTVTTPAVSRRFHNSLGNAPTSRRPFASAEH